MSPNSTPALPPQHDPEKPSWVMAIVSASVVILLVTILVLRPGSPARDQAVREPFPAHVAPEVDSGSLQVQQRLQESHQAAAAGDFQQALETVDQALVLDPEHLEATAFRAELLFRLHRSDEMIPLLEFILSKSPDDFSAHANLAYALHYSGRLDEAEAHVAWCLERRPDFVPARRIRAQILRDQGEAEQALDEVRAALRQQPEDLDCRLLEAELLMYQREFAAAWDHLVPLDDRWRSHPRFAATMSRLAELTGRPAEAAAYREILRAASGR